MSEDIDNDIKKQQKEREGIAAFGSAGQFDTLLYSKDKFDGYTNSISLNENEEDEDNMQTEPRRTITAPTSLIEEHAKIGEEEMVDPRRLRQIASREDDYHLKGRRSRILSPDRTDPFSDKTPDPSLRTYVDAMKETEIHNEEVNTMRAIAKKKKISTSHLISLGLIPFMLLKRK